MSNVQTYCGICIRVGFKGVSSAWSLYFGGFWGGVWAVVVVCCMPAWKPSLEDLQLAKIRAVRPKLGAEATLLSLSCPIFQSLSRNLSEIKKLLLFDDADWDLKDCWAH